MHAANLWDDMLGDLDSGKTGELEAAMRMIGGAGRGVLVLLREPQRSYLSKQVAERAARARGEDTGPRQQLRDYGIGAQILLDLGVHEMILLSNTTRRIIGLDGYGLKIVEQRPIDGC
jgi:3,4-dihydroxy 2-butanone 4-phosphate synthase/GTP cyclohydrolase II